MTVHTLQNNNEQQKIVSRPRISGKIRQTVYTRDVLTPHINDTLRTDGEIVMEEEFGKEMQNAQQRNQKGDGSHHFCRHLLERK